MVFRREGVEGVGRQADFRATADDHAAEAAHLAEDVALMVRESHYGWGSPEATNMILAAWVHALLAKYMQDLKTN